MQSSVYRQVTPQLLLEYRTDQYKIQHNMVGSGELTKFYIISGNDNKQYMVDSAKLNNTIYPYIVQEDYYYPGNKAVSGLKFIETIESQNDPVVGEELSYDDSGSSSPVTLGNIIRPFNYKQQLAEYPDDEDIAHGIRQAQLQMDTIRVYLPTGYVMNSISGINIKVSAKCSKVLDIKTGTYKKVNKDFYFLNYFLPKEHLKNSFTYIDAQGNLAVESVLKFLPSPLYMNSKFYDRYIEVSFPAPQQFNFSRESFLNSLTDIEDPEHISDTELFEEYLRLKQVEYTYSEEDPKTGEVTYYRGAPNAASGITIEFSTVSPDYLEYIEKTGKNPYEAIFNVDGYKQIYLKPESSSNFFNAYLYEDPAENTVTYMPVYGDPSSPQSMQGIDVNIMGCIETGVIPLYDFSDYDTMNDGMEDFIEMYGPDFYKWVIINELSVTYHYDWIVKPDSASTPQPLTEYFTNTIDYTGKTAQHGEFWKSRFIPYIKKRPNMECVCISVKYVTHLYNRMNNRNITKTASIQIKNPIRYQRRSIDTTAINQYKIINRIEQAQSKVNTNGIISNQVNTQTQYVKSYYQNNNLVLKGNNSDVAYEQGTYTIKLFRRSSQYKFNLFENTAENILAPYNLTGNQAIKLEFPGGSSEELITINPIVDNTQNKLQAGQLMFYISAEKAQKIMQTPSSERRFALVTYIPGSSSDTETTLFEGYVDWLTK